MILQGTRMAQIARQRGYLNSSMPPYRVFGTDTVTVDEMYRIEDIAKTGRPYHNSGAFPPC
jgi:hypothetical protein